MAVVTADALATVVVTTDAPAMVVVTVVAPAMAAVTVVAPATAAVVVDRAMRLPSLPRLQLPPRLLLQRHLPKPLPHRLSIRLPSCKRDAASFLSAPTWFAKFADSVETFENGPFLSGTRPFFFMAAAYLNQTERLEQLAHTAFPSVASRLTSPDFDITSISGRV